MGRRFEVVAYVELYTQIYINGLGVEVDELSQKAALPAELAKPVAQACAIYLLGANNK